MPEERIHKILKTLMVIMILVLAYLLPGIWAKREGVSGEWLLRNNRMESGGEIDRTLDEQVKEGNDRTESAEDRINGGIDGEKNRNGTSAETEDDVQQETTAGNKLILLDPGHGGGDPGMVGVGGVEEKNINLQVAQVLKTKLEAQGFSVILTRTEDVGLYDAEADNKKAQDMQRRCAMIEEKKPLLTVSIHQNSYTDSAVCGPQVFYFEHSAEGKKLATCIQAQMNEQLEIARPRAIKGNTNYYILKRSEGVTVLVECAFLSNLAEAEKIQTEEYQEEVAEAICGGILEYLELGE